MKKVQVLMLLAGLVASHAVIAAEEPWHPIDKSITAMLNEGWVIRQYAPPTNLYRLEETFILEKDGKYVRCKARTTTATTSRVFPDPHEHVESVCESLN